jgi:hypothetical protein
MLRDVLTSVDGVVTWPCDEINLIWKHGNHHEPSDELSPEHARAEVREYIRGRFERLRRRRRAPVVVEKTCATSLRVEFTRRVLPEATYVFITRDGLDAAASAMKRWHAPFDLRYTAAKVRVAPPADLMWHGWRFAAAQLRRRAARGSDTTGTTGGVSRWWGPRPHDFRELMRNHPLDELCAIQWQRCVEASWRGLDGLPSAQLVTVRYEDFVADPVTQAARLAETLGLTGTPDVDHVSARSVGKGRDDLGREAVARLETLLAPTLERMHNA